MQKLVLFLLVLASLYATELQFVDTNAGRESFIGNIKSLKIYPKPWEVVKITMIQTNSTIGFDQIRSEDLAQLQVLQRFKNLKALELNFSYNQQITNLDSLNDILARNTYLNTVSLYFVDCQIDNAYAIQNLFQYTQNLAWVEIVLMGNQLKNIYFLQQAFKNNNLLRQVTINVDENQIQNLNGLNKLFPANLQLAIFDFEASRNPLKHIDDIHTYVFDIKQTVSDISLILNYNLIEDISPLQNAFASCEKLVNLTVNINHGKIYDYSPIAEAKIPSSVNNLILQTERCSLATNPQKYDISFTSDGKCSASQKNNSFLGY